MCPAANIGDSLSYFEPIHGSAPDIAGRSLANPTSQILAAAMMLDHMGESRAARLLQQAVWEMYAKKRIPLMPTGAVEGGATTLVKALREELKLLSQ